MKPITILLAAGLLGGAIFFYQRHVNTELASARQAAAIANQQMHAAVRWADSTEAAGSAHVAQAVKVTAQRVARAPATARLIAASPDVCKEPIAALQKDVADLTVERDHYRAAYDDEKAAAGQLKTAGISTAQASQQLVRASGGFWKAITPQIGIGAAAGISAIDRRPDAVIGITLGWHF